MDDTTKPHEYRFIGKPLPRKEDERLVTGKGRFSDDFALPGQAYAAMVRSPHPHARIVEIDAARAKAMPGVLGVFTGADCAADKLKPIPHDPVPKTKYDMKLHAPGGGAVFIGPQIPLPADKARHVGEAVAMVVAETKAQAMDAAEAVDVRYEELPFVLHSEDAMRPGAPALWNEVKDNILVDTPVRRYTGDRRGVRARRACGDAKIPCRPRDRRADGTARRARRLRCRDRPLYALCRLGRRGAAEERNRRRARRRARDRARSFARRRRQFRHPQPRLRRVRSGAVGVAQARPSGQIHRDALGSLPQRLPRPRSGDRGRAGARRRRPLPRHARDQYQQCRRALRVAVAAGQRRGAHSWLLCHCRRDLARRCRLHQHHADQRLPQLRPAGSHLRHRAAGRCRRRRARYRPRQAAAQESRFAPRRCRTATPSA